MTPTFSSDAAEFFLTLPNLNYGLSTTSGAGKSSAKSSAKRTNAKSDKTARIILRAIKSDMNVSVRELQTYEHFPTEESQALIQHMEGAVAKRWIFVVHG